MRQVDRAARACWSPPTRDLADVPSAPSAVVRRARFGAVLAMSDAPDDTPKLSTATRLFHRPPQSSSPTPGICPHTLPRHPGTASHRPPPTCTHGIPPLPRMFGVRGVLSNSLARHRPSLVHRIPQSFITGPPRGRPDTGGGSRGRDAKRAEGLSSGCPAHARSRPSRSTFAGITQVSEFSGGICRSSGGSVDGWRGVG